YYWRRDESGSSAELDYIMQHKNKVIPIEVKAGAAGKLKSLHLFMGLKKYTTAVRVNSGKPCVTAIETKNTNSELIEYNLLSIPFYLLGQLHRLLGGDQNH